MAAGVKRKRFGGSEHEARQKENHANKESLEQSLEKVRRLEALISESNKHLNHIRELLSLSHNSDDDEIATCASIASCRTFCRLVTRGTFKIVNCDPAYSTVNGWLEERYAEYSEQLIEQLDSNKIATQRIAVTLLLRLVKVEAEQDKARLKLKGGLWIKLARCLIISEKADAARSIFVDEYIKGYQDIKLYFCRTLT